MNLLAIIVVVTLILFTLRGYRRGFIRSLGSMISLVVSIVMVSVGMPYVTEFLETKTPVYEYVKDMCETTFSVEKLSGGKIKEEKSGASSEKTTDERTAQEQILDSLGLPKMLQNLLKHNNTTETYKKLAVNTVQEYVPGFMTNLIMKVISFFATWILVSLAVWAIFAVLDMISMLPVIHGLNRVLGLGLGFLQGMAIVWIAFLIITIFSSTEMGARLLKMISENQMLHKLYDANILVEWFQNVGENLF